MVWKVERMKVVRGKSVFLTSYGTLIALSIIFLTFSLLSPDVFPTLRNLLNITRQISLLAIIATGATVIMTVGEFDLSIGAMASFGGVLATGLVVGGMPIPIATLLTLALAFIFGLGNGYLVTHFKVFSFITTLSSGTMLSGVTFWYTGGATIFGGIPEPFLWLGQGMVGPLPVPTILMFLVVVLFWFLLGYTEFGRRLYAIGGNQMAAELSGVRVARDKTLAYGCTALLAASAGIILASRLGSAHPTAG
ncbi:MAG TPA: ABC transporter permease, partial [Candidatus Atribacteria bacterium]|nr:ABC transporter permease [Candidatus Atribacteria bacterium]